MCLMLSESHLIQTQCHTLCVEECFEECLGCLSAVSPPLCARCFILRPPSAAAGPCWESACRRRSCPGARRRSRKPWGACASSSPTRAGGRVSACRTTRPAHDHDKAGKGERTKLLTMHCRGRSKLNAPMSQCPFAVPTNPPMQCQTLRNPRSVVPPAFGLSCNTSTSSA